MSVDFPKEPICEKCGKDKAVSFCLLVDSNKSNGRWMFCCSCMDNELNYQIDIDRFFSSPASTVDWLAHMNEKTWIDWIDFMSMMERFRKATDSYSQL